MGAESWVVVERAASVELERRVRGSRGVRRRRVLLTGLVEHVARPLARAVVGCSELLERERLAQPATELGDDQVDVSDDAPRLRRAGDGLLDPAAPVFPLLAGELDVHQVPDDREQQPSGGQRGSASARIRAPRSYPGRASANAA